MTYLLPPLNALRAFEAAARHLSFKLAAHELHVTAGAVSQQVKLLEERLGLRLFERRHRQLLLTAQGRVYLPAIRLAFRGIAAATSNLKPSGIGVVVNLGVHANFDLSVIGAQLSQFRKMHPRVGLRLHQPAGLDELLEGKVDLAIEHGLSRYPGYRCDRLEERGMATRDVLICPIGTADCPEVETLREWLLGPGSSVVPVIPRRAGRA